MSAKNLLLTATFLSPLLLAMAGTALAQDANQASPDNTTQTADDATTTAVEVGKIISDDPEAANDIANGAGSSVLADADAEDAKETPMPATITMVSVNRISHDCFWWNSVTYFDGYTGQQKTVEFLIGPDPACATPQPTFAPGVDWIRPDSNGNTYIHHTDGTMELKDKDGKVIGMIPPAVTAPQPHEEPKEHTSRPANNTDHALKTQTSEVPHQAKLEQNKTVSRTANLEHASAGAHRTASLGHSSMAAHRMANLGHSMAAPSRMMNIGHLAMGVALGHGMGMMPGLGHGGGMIRGSGMHMGGMHMGKR